MLACLALAAVGSNGPVLAAPRPEVTVEPSLVLVTPAAGERVEETAAHLEVQAAPQLQNVRIVLSRQPFTASNWTDVPQGSDWIVAPYSGAPVAIAALRLPVRTESACWWVAVGVDTRNGRLLTSEVRRFTVLPRFSNRVATDVHPVPARTGTLPADRRSAKAAGPRPLELAAGYILAPGQSAPRVTADFLRASQSMHAALQKTAANRAAYVVQFGDITADRARQRIEAVGGSVVAALSDGTYLARMPPNVVAHLEADSDRPGIASWEPAYKVSPRIDRASGDRAALTALVFPDGDGENVLETLQTLGATDVRLHRNGINQLVRFEIETDRVADAAALADITWIEPTPRDSVLNKQAQWVVQTNVSESRRIWDLGLRGQGQIVMTSDSGIRTNHEMFEDPADEITGFGDYPANRKIIAYKRGSDHPYVEFGDDAGSYYHGTHTAGSVAGNNDPTTTTNAYDGMAKEAKLYFMDLGGTASRGSIAAPPDLNDLFLPSYLGNTGGAARLSSNSWGSPGFADYTLASMQVDQFMWDHPDYLILFANGNSSVVASVSSPATAKNCLSVGGTGNGTERTSLYTSTSRGPTHDLRRKPTICAPGDLVGSSVGTTRYAYSFYSGTSMATPVATGAMALIRQYLTEGWYPTGAPVVANAFNPSAALLKAMAINSGDNDVAGSHVPDNNIGWGRIDIDNVLYFPGDARRTLLIDTAQGLVDRQFVEYQVRVDEPAQPFSVSLCWTDAPGNPYVVRQLVNDLDLVVTNGSVTYLGNRMFNNVSLVGAGRDSFNVEECVRIPAPPPSTWTVRIEGHRILAGPQPYALCITGGVGLNTGSLALDRYDCAFSDTLGIEVLDGNASLPLQVTVASPTDPFGESVSLAGANGVFHGGVVLAPSAPNPNDHRLAVSSGDLVTVTYADAAPTGSVVATARVNARAPVVTDVHARSLSSTVAVVSWTTDIPSTSHVQFGLAGMVYEVAESAGYAYQHSVRLAGLRPQRNYQYDVESTSRTGAMSRDNFGGMHRSFTTKAPGRIAVVLSGETPQLLDTWMNALAAIGWDADVFAGPDAQPPLVGDKSVGLRSYSCVLWQVGPDDYPPISDPQRAAIDSLLEGGGRLLITGHDIGYGLADASVFSYTPERELWLEHGLKTRYYYDELDGISVIKGANGDPTSGAYIGGLPYFQVRRSATSDLIGPAPGTDGIGTSNWFLDSQPPWPCGLRWESNAGKGARSAAFWGGQKSRLVAMYFEWAGLASSNSASVAARTDVLAQSVAWLLDRRPPSVTVMAPTGGTIVSSDLLAIHYSITAQPGRTIAGRSIAYSLDGGETWKPLSDSAGSDSVYVWDLRGGASQADIPNSTRALIRVVATDDGDPALSGQDDVDAVFTIARSNGDTQGPVLVAGSLRVTPTPVRAASPATLDATFSDAATGGGQVVAAEYSVGASAVPGGSGSSMTLETAAITAAATIDLQPNSLPAGPVKIWVRGRDTAGNWGAAAALAVVVNGEVQTDTGEIPPTSFVAALGANPFHGPAAIRYGLAQTGSMQLELFDARGRHVRTLASGSMIAGTHFAQWDGRDNAGAETASGVFFVRLTTPAGVFGTRLVMLH